MREEAATFLLTNLFNHVIQRRKKPQRPCGSRFAAFWLSSRPERYDELVRKKREASRGGFKPKIWL